MKAIGILVLALAIAACSTKSVRCDGRLTAINPPAKVMTSLSERP